MPAWLVVQTVIDIGLMAVILWLSWRPNSAIAKQKTHLAGLLSSAELKTAQLHAQLQRADALLGALGQAEDRSTPEFPVTPTMPLNPYEEASRLAREGYTVDEIARLVKLPRGEVGLIMHLKERAQVQP